MQRLGSYQESQGGKKYEEGQRNLINNLIVGGGEVCHLVDVGKKIIAIASQHPPVRCAHNPVTLARCRAESRPIEDMDFATAVADQPGTLQLSGCNGHGGALYPEHLRQK